MLNCEPSRPKLFPLFAKRAEAPPAPAPPTPDIAQEAAANPALPDPDPAGMDQQAAVLEAKARSPTPPPAAGPSSRPPTPPLVTSTSTITKTVIEIDSAEEEEPSVGSGMGARVVAGKGKGRLVTKGAAAGSGSNTLGQGNTKKKKRPSGELILSSSDEDDDLVIIEPTPSSSTGTSSSPASFQSRTKTTTKTAKPRAKKSKLKSSVVQTQIITIPDSPEKGAFKTLPRVAPGGSFASLSEVYKHSRAKREVLRKGWEPRWPWREEQEGHCARGEEVARVGSAVLRVGQRWAGERDADKEMDVMEELDVLTGLLDPASVASDSRTWRSTFHPFSHFTSLVPPHPNHPLLDRLSNSFIHSNPNPDLPNHQSTTLSKDIWTVKYAPRSADEVLGGNSRRSARLLREWLKELALSGDRAKRKRPVGREVKAGKKPKRPDDDDKFLASSSDESSSSSSSDSTPSRRTPFQALTNLILLCGPSGSGKTSAVHTIASELGWTVFEVYPGIGKRGAKDIEKLVGDVSKNHMVWKGGDYAGGTLGSPGKGKGRERGDAFEALKMAADAGIGKGKRKGKGKEKEKGNGVEREGKGERNQSLILFDEVDVLYNEDKDFWTGLINLGKESSRPIILTCSDISLIPFDILPLQLIRDDDDERSNFLAFVPPEPALATPFLQLVALSERTIIDTAGIVDLYASFPSDNATSATARGIDLRKAICQLQMNCQIGNQGGLGGEENEKQKGTEGGWFWNLEVGNSASPLREETEDDGGRSGLEKAAVAMEAQSFADAFVNRRAHVSIAIFESNPARDSPDQEFAVFSTLDVPLSKSTSQLDSVGREIYFADAITQRAASIWPAKFLRNEVAFDRILEKQSRQTNLAALIHTKVLAEPPCHLAPSTTSFTDFLPFLRALVRSDKQHIQEEEDEVRATRRSTRNSGGSGAPRKFNWSKTEERELTKSDFPKEAEIEVEKNGGDAEMAVEKNVGEVEAEEED